MVVAWTAARSAKASWRGIEALLVEQDETMVAGSERGQKMRSSS